MEKNAAEEYWTNNPNAALREQWTANPLIGSAIYRRMTGGTSKFWLNWLFQDHFAQRSFSRMLSPGCGVGDHEVAASQLGNIPCVDAFDFSESCLDLARAKAQQHGRPINFYRDDLNRFVLPGDALYDLVLCSGSVHHVRELERFFRVIHGGMAPDGRLVINEYIGAIYNLYPDKQRELINRILACFPPELRHFAEYQAHTLEQSLTSDPSESVRAPLIMPLLEQYFDIELRRDYGGMILHPLYPLLRHEALAEPTPQNKAIVQLLIELEAILLDEQSLGTDFTLCIAKPKPMRSVVRDSWEHEADELRARITAQERQCADLQWQLRQLSSERDALTEQLNHAKSAYEIVEGHLSRIRASKSWKTLHALGLVKNPGE